MPKMYRKKFFRKRKIYRRKAVNIQRNFFAEKLKKRFTIPVSLRTGNDGSYVFITNNGAFNLFDTFRQSPAFRFLYADAAPKFQRFRITGLAISWYPNTATILGVTQPFALALYPDYAVLDEYISIQSVFDQRDRFLCLPNQSTMSQRKYWAFPTTVNNFNDSNKPGLGAWLDVNTFANAAVDSYSGLVVIASYAGSTLLNTLVGYFMLNLYVQVDKPVI